jgi:uncharacterized protein DUF3617
LQIEHCCHTDNNRERRMKIHWALALTLMATMASAGESMIEPGLYEVVAKTSLGPAETSRKCMTAAEIAKGMQPQGLPKECKITHNTLGNGKLDFATSCPNMTTTMTGTYTATSYVMDAKMSSTAGGKATEVTSHVTAKKIGATCKDEE